MPQDGGLLTGLQRHSEAGDRLDADPNRRACGLRWRFGAFARLAVVAQPATLAFIEYCHAEATALIEANRDIAEVLAFGIDRAWRAVRR